MQEHIALGPAHPALTRRRLLGQHSRHQHGGEGGDDRKEDEGGVPARHRGDQPAQHASRHPPDNGSADVVADDPPDIAGLEFGPDVGDRHAGDARQQQTLHRPEDQKDREVWRDRAQKGGDGQQSATRHHDLFGAQGVRQRAKKARRDRDRQHGQRHR